MNSARTVLSTWIRLAAVHACPVLRILAAIAPSTAASRSASANTTNGAFPPSSIDVRSTPVAACARSCLPTPVEPVNVTLRNRLSAKSGVVRAAALDVGRIDSTPRGRPVSAKTCPSSSIVSGVSAAGFTTMVQPAANAGAIFRVAIASGKFHGVIASVGPTGCLVTRMRPLPDGDGV